jgi:RNA polymerase sigma factor (sigma-70 family)
MPVRVPLRLPAAFVADDDQALLARFAVERDESAFAAIVGRHARMVYGVCRRAVRDEHLAEDAFQAVFLVLTKNPGSAAAASSLGGWLFGIARRVGLAARRHEERRHRREQQAAPPGERSADFDDLLRVLDEELGALPDAYRAPLVACFLEERTQDEAARELGWSLSTLRRRLERGKELLRARLTRRGATLAGGLFAGILAPSAALAVPPRLLASAASPSPLAQSLAAEAARGAVGVKLALAAVALVAVGGLGFAVSENRALAPPTRPDVPAAHAEAAPAPRPASRAAVALTGRVVFPEERDIPPLKFVPAGAVKDQGFFGLPIDGELVIEPRTRGLANAVVWLRPDSDDPKATFPADRTPAAEAREHFVTAGREGFTPRILAVRAGDRVTFGNPTPIAFNVRYQRAAGMVPMGGETGEFNVLLPADRTHTTKPLPALRIGDMYADSIHPWVKGYVWSFDHPYFAVTDSKGNFSIPNAPAGTWRLMVWHEKVGYRDGAKGRLGTPVTVRGDGKMELGRVVMSSPGWNEKDE